MSLLTRTMRSTRGTPEESCRRNCGKNGEACPASAHASKFRVVVELKQGIRALSLGAGVLALAGYGFVATFQPDPNFGRVFVASGERNIRLGLRFSF